MAVKEAILYRISMTKDRRKNYGKEVKSIHKVAKNLLRQVKKQVQISPVVLSCMYLYHLMGLEYTVARA